MYKVMVVEDEDLIRKGLVYVFDWTKYDCVVIGEAANGQEALDLINVQVPDIIITDIRMPLMDGIQLLEAIKDKKIETIILSGYAEFEYAKKAISYGVTEYILKPISHEKLGSILKGLCKKIRVKSLSGQIEERMKVMDQFQVLDLEIYYIRSDYHSRYTPKALAYIQENYGGKINIDQVASALEVSGAYLRKNFKLDTGHTFNDFLTRYRIQKALNLMLGSDYKIYQIAEMVGFSDYKYFSQVFKNHVQYTPSDFLQLDVMVKNT